MCLGKSGFSEVGETTFRFKCVCETMAREEIVNTALRFCCEREQRDGKGREERFLLLLGISLGKITGYYYVNGNDPVRGRWQRGELLV